MKDTARLSVSRATDMDHEDPKDVVNEQAEDEGLWCHPHYASEAYMQQALRRLHAAVEGVSPTEAALRALSQRPNN